MSQISLIKAPTSEKVRLNFRPYIVLTLKGSSYLNKKAASLLDLKHGDVLAFYQSSDGQKWFIANDNTSGAEVRKNGGLFRFCETKIIKRILESYGVNGKKAFFPVAEEIEEIDGIKVLLIIPKAYNVA